MTRAFLISAMAAVQIAAAASTVQSGEPETEALRHLVDERAVIRVVDAVDRAVDGRDWAAARSHFAETVRIDFTSLTGQPPATIPSDSLIEGWAGNLKGSKTSLHLRTNHDVRIDGLRAVVQSHGYAWNRMDGNGDPLWEVWGTYEHRLTRGSGGWKIDGFTFTMTHERGNPWVRNTPGQE